MSPRALVLMRTMRLGSDSCRGGWDGIPLPRRGRLTDVVSFAYTPGGCNLTPQFQASGGLYARRRDRRDKPGGSPRFLILPQKRQRLPRRLDGVVAVPAQLDVQAAFVSRLTQCREHR